MKNKGNSMQAALNQALPDSTTSEKKKETETSNNNKHYRPSRDGKKLIAGYFDPQIAKRLKYLTVEEDTTIQALLEEAVELLLVKKNMK